MSFGYGVGDVVAVGLIAWNVYKACRDAPGSFKNISQEVLSLHAVLKEVEECLTGQSLSTSRQSRLKVVTDGCGSILQELQALVDKYRTLDTRSRRTLDRVGFASEDIADLRSRLISNTGLLTAYLGTTQVYVGRRLNDLMRDFQAGRHESSVISSQSLESISREDREIWRTIRKELADIGISIAAFDANKMFIMDWFKTAIDNGAFDEQVPDDSASSFSYDSTDSQTTEGVPSVTTPTTKSPVLNAKSPVQVLVPAAKSQKQPVKRRALPALVIWWLQYKKQLREAVEDNNQTRVRQLLDDGVNPNVRWSDGLTALHYASGKGDKLLVQLLLKKGADIDIEDTFTVRTALQFASINGHTDIVQLLLEKGANINSIDINGRTALQFALIKGHTDIVQLLLEKGANINSIDIDGRTALQFASKEGNTDMVQLLLDKGANANTRAIDGKTALHWASWGGHIDTRIVWLLLENHANVDIQDTDGKTALHVASMKGHTAAVQLLLENGANADTKAIDGKTALIWASSGGYMDIVALLLRNDATVDIQDRDGETALLCALSEGHKNVVQMLLEKGANTNMGTKNGRAALLLAVMINDKVIVRRLLEIGVNIDARDYIGGTALHYASACGYEDLIQLLLRKGANFNAKNNLGLTALHWASINGHMEVVQLLLEKGADSKVRDRYGNTALSEASKKDYKEIVDLLEWCSELLV